MIRQTRTRLHDIPYPELAPVIEALCHESIDAFPVYECVKVFARVSEDGHMTYARHRNDLGTTIVHADDIVSRFKNEEVRKTTSDALRLIEENLLESWPFSPGSSSWVQIEILDKTIRKNGPINHPSIVFRKAVRLSSTKNDVRVTSTPLVERIFSQFEKSLPESIGRFTLMHSPSITLKNIAGSGLVTESIERIELNEDPQIVIEDIACKLIRENMDQEPFISPGFSFIFEGNEYQVTSRSYGSLGRKIADEKKALPIPLVGVVR